MRGLTAARGTYQTTRDPFKWPFLATSIWNTPIGSNATYSAFHATTGPNPTDENPLPGLRGPGMGLNGNTGLPGGYWTWLNYGNDPNFVITARTSDPLRNVYVQQAWGPGRGVGTTLNPKWPGGPTPWLIHIPDSMVIADAVGNSTPNAVGALVQPSGAVYNFNVMCRPVAGADDFHAWTLGQIVPYGYTEAFMDADNNVFSNGMYGNHGASCLGGYGGTLMSGELTGSDPIHHALSMNINGAEYLHYNFPNYPYGGFRWPAISQDADSIGADWVGGYHGHYPDLTMGSLLAIPPSVTAASLGITTVPGLKLFHAFQDYGAYVIDDTGWSSVDINMDAVAIDEFWSVYGYGPGGGNPYAGYGNAALYNDQYAIGSALMVVSNNSASSVGGGGVPRVPLAPPFAS